MQSVSAAFTAEATDVVRHPVYDLQVSWKKETTFGNRLFTIGVSTIGGNDVIGINPGAVGSPGNYKYFDETAYVESLSWEYGLNFPVGGLSKGMAEARLVNTTDRFTPDYLGGNSELFTAILPRRPAIIGAGFEVDGIPQTIPQFTGIFSKQPRVSKRDSLVDLQMEDYIGFFENRFLDQEIMFTAQRTDQVLQTLFDSMGLSTSQYELDEGLNTIPFGLFEKGTRFSDIMHELAIAENGNIHQDEMGIIRFENRQHYYLSPFNQIQHILMTAQVMEANVPNEDNIINVVEIRSPIREKQPLQSIFVLPSLSYIEIPASSTEDKFFEFQDPVLSLTDPTNGGTNSFFVANSASDESGSDVSSSVSFTNLGTFAKSVKYRIRNNTGATAYVTQLVLAGRVAKQTGQLYFRNSMSASVTAYEERVLSLQNDYIQNPTWAESFSNLILQDFSTPESMQTLTIRAVPQLQIGDLISWQGRSWRVYDIKAKLDKAVGFVQEIKVVKRVIASYFTIGVSTIGSTDQIAP